MISPRNFSTKFGTNIFGFDVSCLQIALQKSHEEIGIEDFFIDGSQLSVKNCRPRVIEHELPDIFLVKL